MVNVENIVGSAHVPRGPIALYMFFSGTCGEIEKWVSQGLGIQIQANTAMIFTKWHNHDHSLR